MGTPVLVYWKLIFQGGDKCPDSFSPSCYLSAQLIVASVATLRSMYLHAHGIQFCLPNAVISLSLLDCTKHAFFLNTILRSARLQHPAWLLFCYHKAYCSIKSAHPIASLDKSALCHLHFAVMENSFFPRNSFISSLLFRSIELTNAFKVWDNVNKVLVAIQVGTTVLVHGFLCAHHHLSRYFGGLCAPFTFRNKSIQ